MAYSIPERYEVDDFTAERLSLRLVYRRRTTAVVRLAAIALAGIVVAFAFTP